MSTAGIQDARSMSDGLIGDAQPTLLPACLSKGDMACPEVSMGPCRTDGDGEDSMMLVTCTALPSQLMDLLLSLKERCTGREERSPFHEESSSV